MTEIHKLEQRLADMERERTAADPAPRKTELRPVFGPEG